MAKLFESDDMRNIQNSAIADLDTAYRQVADLLLYCDEADTDLYEELASRILDIKYELVGLKNEGR